MMDKEQTRPETGSMRFGDDWRGVFIRGDIALHYYLTLTAYIQAHGESGVFLQGLADTLYLACQTQLPNLPPISTECQEMKPFEEALHEDEGHICASGSCTKLERLVKLMDNFITVIGPPPSVPINEQEILIINALNDNKSARAMVKIGE